MTQGTDTPDASAAARQLMQLWQKQIALLMQDPEVARSGLQFWQQMSQAMAGAPNAWPLTPSATSAESHAQPSSASPTPNAPGLADVAVLHQLLELQSRLAACERRIIQLESQLGDGTGQP